METGLIWKRSAFCTNAGSCIEVALTPGHIYVRDSKAPKHGPLKFTSAEWEAFLKGVKAGEFDR